MASVAVKRKLSENMNMCEGPLLKKIVSFAVPLIFTNLLQLMFNAADLIVVGRFCGSNSVAAVGATTSLVHLIVNLFIGLSTGAGVAVATAIGAGNSETVKKTVHTAIPLAVICGILLTVIGLLTATPILRLMKTPTKIIHLSSIYLKIYFAGMIPCMLYNFGAAILRADGDTKRPLFFLTLAGVINIILNIVFVLFFDMNVAGVALATTISQTISAVLVMLDLMQKNDFCRFSFKHIGFYPMQLKNIIKIGLPAGLQSVTFSLSNVIIQSSVNSFSEAAVAGSAAAGNIEGFIWAPVDAFQQAALNFAGQNYGAGKIDRVRKTLRIILILGVAVELVLGIAATVFAKPLLSLYITDSPKAIEYGTKRMYFVSLLYFIATVMNTFSGILRGMNRSVEPMCVSIFTNCVFRILWVGTVFRRFGTWELLFSSYPISWTLAIVLQLCVYIAIMRRYTRQNGKRVKDKN